MVKNKFNKPKAKKRRKLSYRFYYTLIGGFMGICLSMGALIIDFIRINFSVPLLDLYTLNKLHFLFASSPLILAFVAGLVGIREEKIRQQGIELESFAHDLTERTYEMTDIMNHIEEGILTINKDFSINREYSTFLEKIFGKLKLSNKNFLQLVFPTGNIKRKNDLQEYLDILFTNFSTADDVLKSLNPIENLEYAFSEIKGEVVVKYLNFEFVRIILEQKLTKVMVIIKDLTESVIKERHFAKERLEYEEELERISALLRMPKKELNEFLEKCDNTAFYVESFFSKGVKDIINKTNEMAKILSDLHSLKGETNLYDLKQLAAKIHTLEEKSKNVINFIKEKSEELIEPSGELTPEINQMMDVMVAISDFRISIRHLKETKTKMIAKVKEDDDSAPLASQQYLVKDFMPKIHQIRENLNQIINSYEMVTSIQSNLKKENWLNNLKPFFEKRIKEVNSNGEVKKFFPLEIHNNLSDAEISSLSVIKASIIHLLQNALVHGIESPQERLELGKNEKGKIKLNLQKAPDFFEIIVEDDGQGIVLQKIKEILKSKSQMSQVQINNLTIKDAIKIIFKSGFSSRDHIDQISGQGIGMDAIRRQVQKYNGKLLIRNKLGNGLLVCLSFSIDSINP